MTRANFKKGFKKACTAMCVLFSITYLAFAAKFITNKDVSNIQDTSWVDRDQRKIKFYDSDGTITIDGKKHGFTFEEKNGFIQIELITDQTFVELNHIEGGKLFCVTYNSMFYEITEQTT